MFSVSRSTRSFIFSELICDECSSFIRTAKKLEWNRTRRRTNERGRRRRFKRKTCALLFGRTSLLFILSIKLFFILWWGQVHLLLLVWMLIVLCYVSLRTSLSPVLLLKRRFVQFSILLRCCRVYFCIFTSFCSSLIVFNHITPVITSWNTSFLDTIRRK